MIHTADEEQTIDAAVEDDNDDNDSDGTGLRNCERGGVVPGSTHILN